MGIQRQDLCQLGSCQECIPRTPHLHHLPHVCPGRNKGTFASRACCLLWPCPLPNLQLHELMQQEFIYKLIIPVTHVPSELGYNKGLKSRPSGNWGGPGPGQAGPLHSKRADGSKGEEVPAREFVLTPAILGFSKPWPQSSTEASNGSFG